MSEVFIVIIVVRGIFERERSRSKRPMITQDAVDSVVLDGIQTRINYLSNPEEVKSLFKEYLGECFNVESMSMPEIDKEIALIEKEMDRLIYAHAKFDRPLPEDEVHRLKSKKDSLCAKRQELIVTDSPHNSRAIFDLDAGVENFINKMKDAERTILDQNSTPAERIEIREGFLPRAEITWYNDKPTRVDLYWKKLPDICLGIGRDLPLEALTSVANICEVQSSSPPPPTWANLKICREMAIAHLRTVRQF